MITLADMTQAARIQRDPAYARKLVFARDHGVCACCGLDTEALLAAYRAAKAQVMGAHGSRMAVINRGDRASAMSRAIESAQRERAELKAVDDRLRRLGFGPGQALWQAHHDKAVAEGGGGCGLEGYRSLCTPCHEAETSALRARLRRRPGKHVLQSAADRRGNWCRK